VMPRVHSTIGCAMRSSPGSAPYASASETPVRVLSRRAAAPSSHPPSIEANAAADSRPGPCPAACAVTPPILVAGSRSRRANLEAQLRTLHHESQRCRCQLIAVSCQLSAVSQQRGLRRTIPDRSGGSKPSKISIIGLPKCSLLLKHFVIEKAVNSDAATARGRLLTEPVPGPRIILTLARGIAGTISRLVVSR
jgi:hypothetical protein